MPQKPVLYYTPRSPPCRAVLLTAAALGLDLDLRLMNMKEGDHLTPEFLALNPQHTVPVLDDNGLIIVDSHVICAYLTDKYSPDDSLYPKAADKRRQVDACLYFECGHLFPRLRIMVEPILYFGESEIPPQWVVYMQKAYDGLEHYLTKSAYLCGDNLTIADLACIATVSSSHIFAPVDGKKFPKLNAWIEKLSELPYYAKHNQEGASLLKLAVENAMEANKIAKK